jgi:rubrerythrin
VDRRGRSLLAASLAVLLLATVVATDKLRDARRRRLRKQGRCGCCGYDLTGHTNVVCPECGEAAIRADKQKA